MFLQTREQAYRRTVANYDEFFTELDDDGVRQLATFSMAMADGLFIAREIEGDAMDLLGAFETLAAAILGAADHLATGATAAPVDDPCRSC